MFELGELDRTGFPSATLPQDAIAVLREKHQLKKTRCWHALVSIQHRNSAYE